ncbi:efflux RND transporter permease subunit [Acidithiobacillus caldus]|jgi:multidrug efflux pump subunit AcrB|uniref:Acriflavin resistance protein n=4 Tax=Acidithiobacillus caldus TaxID=33059 RepID=A0A059ZR67_ACICK|nr:efflux RND transporter permease subunit [Acidithiobacillus caldus]AIA55364.1 Acriflavin resistance protein [Acidithiobacillus caldus ATCC 51756]MBU2729565.1 efflux RND transporter permease subunit [Acidithiobacillus caldus]MBU2734912.1 efflux RND transporter permease subunit [Acidithiobacillus caldus ATCC 51756]MBU2744194.1 efflux RND transporter permease subunit [Acidithiobacillus caldus]MBU2783916.1 efflux RND transporter permease subunit [Acidithiobacillus caldus]
MAEGASSLNLAGRLAQGFYRSKITVLIMLAIALFGALAVLVTPRLYNPEIVVPAAEIFVMRPGSDSQETHNLVVRPLEALMASLPGVHHTYGYAMNDMGIVTVEFQVGANEEKSLLEVYNQLSRNIDRMPPGTRQPLVKSIGINDVPIVTVTLSSDRYGPAQLRQVGLRLMEQLQSVPDVANAEVIGGSPEAVNVWLEPGKLASLGLGLQQVRQALEASNVILPAGHLVHNNREIPLRVNAAVGSAQQVGRVIIGSHDGRPIFLHDVARIEEGPAELDTAVSDTLGRANTLGLPAGTSMPAVTITLAKRPGANAVTVADAVKAKLQRLQQEAVPEGIHVTLTRDYGARADDAVSTLFEHLSIAIGVVAVILLLFLGWREAAIVILTVPLTLGVVLGIGWLLGQTINRITLFALILSLGLLVDGGIVVIENIHRHISGGGGRLSFAERVVRATNEIGNPTNIATLAVILAFIPMAFVTGMMGPFMLPIPIFVPIAMIASVLLAYTVVPWGAYRFLRRKAEAHQRRSGAQTEHGQQRDALQKGYIRIFKPLLESGAKRNLFFIVVLILLFLAMLMPAWQFIRPSGMNGPLSALGVNVKMLPEGNVSDFMIQVDTPAGTALDETGRVVQAVGDVLAENPYVENFQSYVGRSAPVDFAGLVRGDMMRQGSNYAQIQVNLVPRDERPMSHAVAVAVYHALKSVRERFPQTTIKIFEVPPGPPVRAQVVAELYGPNYDKLRQLAGSVEAEFRKVYRMVNVDDSVTATVPEYRIHVEQDKAMLAGVAPAQVAELVHDYIAGTKIGALSVPDAREPVDIILRVPPADRAWKQQILDLQIRNRMGKEVPLSSIVEIQDTHEDKPIIDRDQHRVVYVTGDLLGSSPVYAVLSLNHWLDGKTLDGVRLHTGNLGFMPAQPKDITHYQILWGGDMRLTLDVFRDLGAAFIVALVFIYLMLVAYYQSFIMPVIVMGAIPLTLVGVFPGHWLLNTPFNATSMIGVIALAGVVVRNSLLLIDFIVEYRREGYALEDAVLEAGAVRFRPILLTALAIMFGSAIMVTDPVFGGLAVSLIFGTFASTMLTLIVIPLLYYLWERRLERKLEVRS